MAKINVRSIMLKTVKATRDEVETVLKDVAEDGAERFREILLDEMASRGVPQSVIDSASTLTAGEPETYEFLSHKANWYGRGRMEVEMSFDEGEISRDSLQYDSVDSIIDIFNNGYWIKKKDYPKLPSGIWHGNKTYALRRRQGLKFLQAAKRRAQHEIDGVSKIDLAEEEYGF